MNIIDEIEQEQIKEISQKRNVPEFGPGDTLKIHLKVLEGNRERIQVFEGVCIARSNKGLNSSFTVRKISNGEGVERVFPVYSPLIEKFEVVRRGDVRRSKLYYLRDRTGKSARDIMKANPFKYAKKGYNYLTKVLTEVGYKF